MNVVEWPRPITGRFTHRKDTGFPLYSGLGGPHSQSLFADRLLYAEWIEIHSASQMNSLGFLYSELVLSRLPVFLQILRTLNWCPVTFRFADSVILYYPSIKIIICQLLLIKKKVILIGSVKLNTLFINMFIKFSVWYEVNVWNLRPETRGRKYLHDTEISVITACRKRVNPAVRVCWLCTAYRNFV